jgi:HK97 gp10 family phage protein
VDNRFARKGAVLQKLRRLPVAIRIEARKALDDEAKFLVDQIRPHIPREEGELADSLEWHRNPRGDKIGVIITEGRNQEGDPLDRKARAVEFGRPDMAAQPHFYPTYRAHKRKMANRVVRRVRKVIRAIWGGNR